MLGVLLFHIQAKQNLSVKRVGGGGGKDQGGVTVPRESGEHVHTHAAHSSVGAEVRVCGLMCRYSRQIFSGYGL